MGTETLLTLCEDLGYMHSDQCAPVRGLLDEVGKMPTVMRRNHRQT